MSPRETQPRSLYRAADFDIDESIGYLIKRCRVILSAAVEREIAEHGVTYEQWGVLLMILKERGDTAAMLAREMECDTGSMTRMIDRLEAKDLIVRTRSTDDRRVVRLELTASGKRLAERLVAAMATVLNRHLAGFSHEELETFKGFLRRIIANRDAT
jgi:DNA-binding MarR family transcriptional regulator